jgi:hypothetical protein
MPVESKVLPLLSEPTEARAAWYVAFVSVTLALVALLPSLPLRVLAVVAGVTLAVTLAPAYLRRATPFSAAAVTVGAAFCAMATVAWLARLPLGSGISEAGGVGRATAWLFDSTLFCLGIGVLATGRLIVREGYRRDDLLRRGYLPASALPVITAVCFLVIALCPIGGSAALARAHIIATWAALGSFWCAIVASWWLRGLSRPLRYYSSVAAVLIFVTSVPDGLRLVHLTKAVPFPMFVLEVGTFSLCLVWFCWLAREWSSDPTCRKPASR